MCVWLLINVISLFTNLNLFLVLIFLTVINSLDNISFNCKDLSKYFKQSLFFCERYSFSHRIVTRLRRGHFLDVVRLLLNKDFGLYIFISELGPNSIFDSHLVLGWSETNY